MIVNGAVKKIETTDGDDCDVEYFDAAGRLIGRETWRVRYSVQQDGTEVEQRISTTWRNPNGLFAVVLADI